MHHTAEILSTKKNIPEFIAIEDLSNAMNETFNCAQVCTNCADACLAEDNVKDLISCINLNLDCADICETTSRVLSRQSQWSQDILHHQLHACLTACEFCGEECSRHADHHEHCRVCADSCHNCAQACRQLINAMHL